MKRKKLRLNKKRTFLLTLQSLVLVVFASIILWSLYQALGYHNLMLAFGSSLCGFLIAFISLVIIRDAIEENIELKKTYKPRHGSKSK